MPLVNDIPLFLAENIPDLSVRELPQHFLTRAPWIFIHPVNIETKAANGHRQKQTQSGANTGTSLTHSRQTANQHKHA